MDSMWYRGILIGGALLALGACRGGDVPSSDFSVAEQGNKAQVQPCSHRSPLKNAYFGDLHVHTGLSSDAASFGVRARPADAYRFAFGGGAIELPAEKGEKDLSRSTRIDRPLDFLGVTDHAEFLGEQVLCADGSSAPFCEAFKEGEGRNPALLKLIFSPFPARDEQLCGADGSRCTEAALGPWQETIAAAEQWYDTSSDCARTTFVAFEYSSVRLGSNLHRNVVFRNTVVPRRPISYVDAAREWRLWEILEKECIDGDADCDALAIPHNSNISNGRMFAVDYPGTSSEAEEAARATLRMRVEPVVEIMQHKGDSECRNNLAGVLGGNDELCSFEKFENLAFFTIAGTPEVDACYDGPLADYVPHKGPNCLSRNSYVRYALIEGLKEEERIGVNPFKLGIIASTDTHNATPGNVSERNFPGHLGWGDGTPERRTAYDSTIPGNASNNPGGLVGVWAEQNRREDIFDAIRNREVFGTSGPRIQPRFFGGWDLPSDLCDDPAMLETAYDSGVAMGNDLPDGKGKAPSFLALAAADAGTSDFPGTPLQRLQIVKGWYDDNGDHHQRVFDVAGNADNGAGVDTQTCERRGDGYAQLCAVWQDPEFDAGQRAVYYMRAVENPSCRYSTWQCLEMPAAQRPQHCRENEVAKTVQERAWSSPIWYTPR